MAQPVLNLVQLTTVCRQQVDQSVAEMQAAATDERALALLALNAELAEVEAGAEGYEAKRASAAATLDALRETVVKMFESSG